MPYRIVGVLTFAISLFVLYIAVRGLTYGTDVAELAATLSRKEDLKIDAANFLLHWRVAGSFLLVLALLGLVAGVTMFFLRPWSCLVLLGMALLVLLWSLGPHLLGYTRYGFEQLDSIEMWIGFVSGVSSLYTYLRWKRRSGQESNA